MVWHGSCPRRRTDHSHHVALWNRWLSLRWREGFRKRRRQSKPYGVYRWYWLYSYRQCEWSVCIQPIDDQDRLDLGRRCRRRAYGQLDLEGGVSLSQFGIGKWQRSG